MGRCYHIKAVAKAVAHGKLKKPQKNLKKEAFSVDKIIIKLYNYYVFIFFEN